MTKTLVATPSRICLFGEHLDYLGLEVIAMAIDLYFSAEIEAQSGTLIDLRLGLNSFPDKNTESIHWITQQINLAEPLEYHSQRDYLKSSLKVLQKNGLKFEQGLKISMLSDIPMGKGMSSSSTMIIAFIKAVLEYFNHPDKDDAAKIAYLAFCAEVTEFNEPGGMMDHYCSALGGLQNLDFINGEPKIIPIDFEIPGSFLLFDSLAEKNTTAVLASAKIPVVNALNKMQKAGVSSIRELIDQPLSAKQSELLSPEEARKLAAAINNYQILLAAKELMQTQNFNATVLGDLLNAHHANLRDGLGISTPALENILRIASQNGALGGKVNGSGGGGCCFVYCHTVDAKRIIQAVAAAGFPGRIVNKSNGVSCLVKG